MFYNITSLLVDADASSQLLLAIVLLPVACLGV